MNALIIPALIMGGLMLASGKKVPRGIRNNNPGNIKINHANNWKGVVDRSKNTDGVFEQFIKPVYGIRALGRLLQTYRRNGFDTIEKIVTRFAPESENKTQNYINFVVGQTGIPAWQSLHDFNYPAIVKAIIHFENGSNPYSDEQIKQALAMV